MRADARCSQCQRFDCEHREVDRTTTATAAARALQQKHQADADAERALLKAAGYVAPAAAAPAGLPLSERALQNQERLRRRILAVQLAIERLHHYLNRGQYEKNFRARYEAVSRDFAGALLELLREFYEIAPRAGSRRPRP